MRPDIVSRNPERTRRYDPEFEKLFGGGEGPKEYIPGLGPCTKGQPTWISPRTSDGTAVRTQTIDTLSEGITPTKYELEAAAHMRSVYPNDQLILIPKRRP